VNHFSLTKVSDCVHVVFSLLLFPLEETFFLFVFFRF